MTTPEYDLAVVGGGVAGLSCAMPAARYRRVALFEDSYRFGAYWTLLKCFFVVEDPWWDEDIPLLGMPNLLARKIHYQKRETARLLAEASNFE